MVPSCMSSTESPCAPRTAFWRARPFPTGQRGQCTPKRESGSCPGAHDQLPWEVKARHLTELSARMATSGYNHGFRASVITSVIEAFRAIQEMAARGVRPVHRPDKMWKGQRGGGYTTTLFVPPTPGSELAITAPGCRCQGVPGLEHQGPSRGASGTVTGLTPPEE